MAVPRLIVGSLLAAAVLAACGGGEGPGTTTQQAGAQQSTQAGQVPTEQLLARANAAMQAQRVFEPADDNALALYVEVAERPETADPGDASRRRRLTDSVEAGTPQQQARNALNDLVPLGVTRVEQALRNGELHEARRILTLLERANPSHQLVRRLRGSYDNAIANARNTLRSTDANQLPPVVSARRAAYPRRAERQGIEGWVFVSYTIQPDGSVADVRVLASEPEGVFDREAVAAMQQWRYESSSRPVRAQHRFDFSLNGGG